MTGFQETAGLCNSHINKDTMEVPVHSTLITPLLELKSAAQQDGINLLLCSGFRSFERQLKIWNDKALGLRPVLDASGLPLNINTLSSSELMFAILHWSALPGTSRHHWGSDFDVVDGDVVRAGYCPQLTLEECLAGGEFEKLHRWLDCFFAKKRSDFYRPYCETKKPGVAPEPWHISYRPLAEKYAQYCSVDGLGTLIAESELALKAEVLANLEYIFEHYVRQYFIKDAMK